MKNKRKLSASYDHAGREVKKSNVSTENTAGTSSAYFNDNQQVSLSTIELNMANLQEQVNSVPSAWFENNTVGEDVIDLTLDTNSDKSDGPIVISSDSEQDNTYWTEDDETIGDSTCSTITACSSISDFHWDDELRVSDDIDTTKHPNLLLVTDYALNTTNLECSTAVTSVGQQNNDYQTTDIEEINNSRSELTTCIYTDNGTACNCSGLINYSDNGIQMTNNIDTTNAFQSRDHENMNTASSSGTTRGSTVITLVKERDNGCLVYKTEYDQAMNQILSEVYRIEKPAMPSLEHPIAAFVVMPLGEHPNGCNGKCTQRSATSSEHDQKPSVIAYSLMRDLVAPNVLSSDDENHPN